MASTASAHGYLKTPRSRNIVAAQDGISWGGTDSDPAPEYCPQCLNRGGAGAACGKINDRSYDMPPNSIGGIMPPNVQGSFAKGGSVDFEVVLTAHHKGHFSFYACAVTDPDAPPTNECFQQHPLEFELDLLYGSQKDPAFPERAYIPPLTYSGIVNDNDGPVPGTLYRYRMKLPEDIEGHLVLLQWHYISGNSCTAEGYNDYTFPTEWGNVRYSHLPVCDNIPEDGDGSPEQFWNCAEISVTSEGISLAPTTAAPVVPTAPATPSPSAAPVTPPPSTPAPTGEGINISTSSRCGVSELDARANCGVECSTTADCADNQWCWNVQENLCGSRPNFAICSDLPEANSNARCGVSELEAREFCGKFCTSDAQCNTGLGELCHGTHLNTCDCVAGPGTDGGRRALRGMN